MYHSWELLGAVFYLAVSRLAGAAVDVRVSKAFYTRPYDMVRLSIISETKDDGATEAPSLGPTAYRSPFRQRWTTKTLHSQLVSVGKTGTVIPIGGGEELHIKLPAPGSRVTGLFFSDPCFSSKGGFRCPNGKKFRVLERLTEVLNRLLASDEFHFWGILGDIFYDVWGGVSSEFFSRLSLQVKSKPFLAVVGNHDLWLGGQPPGGPGDQLGYGFMQFYGQDTVAGLGPTPYNFAGDPDKLQIAQSENFIFGTQIGDMAFFGFSSAHDWASTQPHASAFCAWAGKEATVQAILVLGHWDRCDLGCKEGMDTPSVYLRIKAMPGCSSKRVLSFAGHQHCNRAMNNTGPLDAVSFVVGGAGMYGPGCSQLGFTVLQSRSGINGVSDVQVDYFPIAQEDFAAAGVANGVLMRPSFWNSPPAYDRYEALSRCLARRGYGGCRADHGQSLRAVSMQEIVTPQKMSPSGEIIPNSNKVPASAAGVAPAPPPPLVTVAPAPPPPPPPPPPTTTTTITTPFTVTKTTTYVFPPTMAATTTPKDVIVIPFPVPSPRPPLPPRPPQPPPATPPPPPLPPLRTTETATITTLSTVTKTTTYAIAKPFTLFPGVTVPVATTRIPAGQSTLTIMPPAAQVTTPAAPVQTVEAAAHVHWTPPPLPPYLLPTFPPGTPPPLPPGLQPTFAPGSAGEGHASTTPARATMTTATITVTDAAWPTTTLAASAQAVEDAARMHWTPPPLPPNLAPTFPPGSAGKGYASTTPTHTTTTASATTITTATTLSSTSTHTSLTTTVTTVTATTTTTTPPATMEEVEAAAVLRTSPPPPPNLSPTFPPGSAGLPVVPTSLTHTSTTVPTSSSASTKVSGTTSTTTTRTATTTTITSTTRTTVTTTVSTSTVTIPMNYPTYPPSQAPSLSPSRHNCWHGLHDPGVLWSWEQADWCCKELQLGCHKVASTTTTTQTTSTLTSSTMTRTTLSGQASKRQRAQAQLDGVLKGKTGAMAGRNADEAFVEVEK